MNKISQIILIIILILLAYNTNYGQIQSANVVINNSGSCCDSLSGFNTDSLKKNKYLLLDEWTDSYSTKQDSIEIMQLIDSCNVYKLFLKKEQQIEKYKPMSDLYQFPPYSKIIEVKDLQSNGILNRAIVYWIQYAKVSMYIEEDYDCYSSMMGHGNYNGKIKFSLIDTKLHKLINTIDLTYEEDIFEAETGETYTSRDECMELPFSSPNIKSEMALESRIEYKIKGGDKLHEGLTEILFLDDYNGDGSKLEFAIYYASGGCMGTATSLLGYNKKKDKLIHYPIELKMTSKDSTNKEIIENTITYWLDYTFTYKFKNKKLKYQVDWRGRGGSLAKFDLEFDSLRDCFKGTADYRETD